MVLLNLHVYSLMTSAKPLDIDTFQTGEPVDFLEITEDIKRQIFVNRLLIAIYTLLCIGVIIVMLTVPVTQVRGFDRQGRIYELNFNHLDDPGRL